MSGLTTHVIDGPGNDAIEAFVYSDPRTLIYASPAYIGLVAAETQSHPHWLTAQDASGLRAALPLLVKRGALGPVINSLAFYGSNGGAIVPDGDQQAWLAVVRAFDAFGERIGAVASTLITNPLVEDHTLYEANLPHDLRDERIGQFTVFPQDRQAVSLMALFDDPRPRNIRKAQRSGLKVSRSQSDDAIAFLHATHDQNIRSINGLPKRLDFFQRLATSLPRDAWTIYLAEQDGERVAALLLLYGNQTVEYFTPCVVEKHRSSQALPLLIHDAMVDAMACGYRQWNWGGTWLTQDGVYAFKKKWGTRDIRYHYFTRLRSADLLATTRDTLLREYPGFYVLPFSALACATANQETK
ncbi:MAG: GNAT family N-acetyltransferase [Hydrogenophaga sp.]|uniref:GNAT family N-acetyltransferase n=1 Tax=Hydrogenophaga sp. TaxID=1904254 RepID=UPI0016BA514E|nr:GNAT family N-acetyltransferase [Hydrogenophaga sp.]NIM39996.1 GNAT family N-acetyltransferase [Hydrogenophaga sp.]NIN25192.1 GNAT family N-acetyltransferase [Hydrogenophaga sp.]NIN29759.1 GNAT family N-acetyltransferase [Hydrogenophaga sp.]NIN54231.1 GNAT family N-acetyltransferase [Hydrogenophaga sp.]NIO50644.1 GNAT family N-acetyltransferase [Hydrogenophaga sp.]